MDREFYKLREVAALTGLSYSTLYAIRKRIASRLPGTKTYLVHRNVLNTLMHNYAQNPVESTVLSVQDEEMESCHSISTPSRRTGTLDSQRQAVKELNALLERTTGKPPKSITTD
mgnify:CR=1 FL=1